MAKELAAIIELFEPKVYWEPFVGAANVIQEVKAPVRIGSDLDIHIISYLQSLQVGWLPPSRVSEPEHFFWKTYEPKTLYEFASKAAIAYGCSFAGKWFAGYARDPKSDRNYASNTRNSAVKQAPKLKGIQFFCQSFWASLPEGVDTIYCDPPYKGTNPCGSKKSFNHDFFWAWCYACALSGITVLVTEFEAPSFAHEIWRKTKAADLRKNNGSKLTERLFLMRP